MRGRLFYAPAALSDLAAARPGAETVLDRGTTLPKPPPPEHLFGTICAGEQHPMKARPILLLLFLAGLIGLLSWSYYAVTRPAIDHHRATMQHFVEDLEACCSRKHIRAAQHELYATVAREEAQEGARRLFRAIAEAERAQELYCAEAIGKLGGEYQPPRQVILLRGSTLDNLQQSALAEDSTTLTEAHHRICHHLTSGSRLVAQALIWVAAAEGRERQQALRLLSAGSPIEVVYLVCPRCGNLYRAGEEDLFCPHCLSDSHRFIRFGAE